MTESNRQPTRWNDVWVERMLGILLQIGVILSGLVVLMGGVVYTVRFWRVPARYENFVADRAGLPSLTAVGRSALHGDGRAIIQCGLLLLIATPVARVVFSIVAFALEKDRLYVSITIIVFLILIYSLFGGAT